MLWRAPAPGVWRASTDNDRGCGFPLRAAAWMAADVFVTYSGMKVLEAGPDCVKVQFQFGIPTVPGAAQSWSTLWKHRAHCGWMPFTTRSRCAGAALFWCEI